MIISKDNTVKREGDINNTSTNWSYIKYKSLLDYFPQEYRMLEDEVDIERFVILSPLLFNYKDILEKSKKILSLNKIPIWVIDQSNYDINLIYTFKNVSIDSEEVYNSLYTYLSSECKSPYIVLFYGEYIRFCKISVIDYNACRVSLQGITMLPSNFISFIEKNILPDSVEALDFIHSNEYAIIYQDIIADIAKYQYRANIISLLNKYSANNITKMIGKYVIVDNYGNFKRLAKKGSSWFTPYLDNAYASTSLTSVENMLSYIRYNNPQIVSVTLEMVNNEMKKQGYVK